MTTSGTQYLKSGDTLPIFSAILRDGAGVPIDLLSNYSVVFRLHDRSLPSTVPSLGGAATIVHSDIDLGTDPDDPDLGAVTFTLPPDTVLPPGVYEAEWQLLTPSGHTMTFPDLGFDLVYVSRRLPSPV